MTDRLRHLHSPRQRDREATCIQRPKFHVDHRLCSISKRFWHRFHGAHIVVLGEAQGIIDAGRYPEKRLNSGKQAAQARFYIFEYNYVIVALIKVLRQRGKDIGITSVAIDFGQV